MADIARFAVLSPEDLQRLYENSKNSNTDRSTSTWVNLYPTWARIRGKLQDFKDYPPHELNDVLAQFFAEIRKNDGDDYEPDCLRVMQSSLNRYLL